MGTWGTLGWNLHVADLHMCYSDSSNSELTSGRYAPFFRLQIFLWDFAACLHDLISVCTKTHQQSNIRKVRRISYFWPLRSSIRNKTTFTKYCLIQWISRIPVSFELHWARPGKNHGPGGQGKRNCFKDRANSHRSRAWQIILIFNNAPNFKYVFSLV